MTAAASLSLAGGLEIVTRATAWVGQQAVAAGASEESSLALQLAVEEAATNVVMHGYPDGRQPSLELAFSRQDDDLIVELSDDGVAFDPLAQPPPAPPETIETVRIGGLGIQLMRSSVSEVTYRRRQGRNHLALRRPKR